MRLDERLAFSSAMQRTLKLPKGAANTKRQFPAFTFVFVKRSDCEKKGLEALANAGLPVLESYTDSTDGHVFIVNASSVRHFVYNDR